MEILREKEPVDSGYPLVSADSGKKTKYNESGKELRNISAGFPLPKIKRNYAWFPEGFAELDVIHS